MLSTLTSRHLPFYSNGFAGWDGEQVFDLHLTGHGCDAPGAICFTHCFVKQSSDDSAMKIPGWTFVLVCDDSTGGDGAFWGQCELQVEAHWICLPTSETGISSAVEERCEFLLGGSVAQSVSSRTWM